MPNQNIESTYVDTYRSDVIYLMEQEDTRVASMALKDTGKGETHIFERVQGKLNLTPKVRLQQTDSKFQYLNWDRRTAIFDTLDVALVHEYDDLYKMIVNPSPQFQRKLAASVVQKKDDIVYAAAIGLAANIVTDPATGVKTPGTVALPASQIVNKDVGAANSPISINKLNAAKRINNKNENQDKMVCFINAEGIEALLKEVKATSGDYINGRPIETGDLGMLLGFDFVLYNRLSGAGVSGDPHKILLMNQDAVGLVTGPEGVVLKVDVRPGLSYLWQFYLALTAGAVRLEDERVIVIESVVA